MNDYQIVGTLLKDGQHQTFLVERRADSSRNAYVTVRDALLNDGARAVLVVAIRIRCDHCQRFHMTVDPACYMEVI